MFGFLSGMMPMFSGATAKFGLPQNFLPTMAHIESSGNPRLVNPKSGAAGLFQFMPDTAKSYGLKNPMDPIASTDAAARLARDNMKGLQTALGRPPTSAELYLAHQQGLGGAKALLANPGVNAVDALTPLYKSRSVAHQAIVNNGGDPRMTAGQFAGKWTSKFAGVETQMGPAIAKFGGAAQALEGAMGPSAGTLGIGKGMTDDATVQPMSYNPSGSKTPFDGMLINASAKGPSSFNENWQPFVKTAPPTLGTKPTDTFLPSKTAKSMIGTPQTPISPGEAVGDPGQAMIGPVAPNVAPNVTPLAVQGGQVASGPTGPFNFQPSFAPDDVVGYQREMAARGGQPMPPAPVAASVAGSAAGPATVPGGTPFSALPQLFGQGGGAKIAPLSVGPTAVQVGMAPMQAGVQTDARGQPIRLPIPGNGSPAFSATNPFWFFGWPPTGR